MVEVRKHQSTEKALIRLWFFHTQLIYFSVSLIETNCEAIELGLFEVAGKSIMPILCNLQTRLLDSANSPSTVRKELSNHFTLISCSGHDKPAQKGVTCSSHMHWQCTELFWFLILTDASTPAMFLFLVLWGCNLHTKVMRMMHVCECVGQKKGRNSLCIINLGR